MSPASSPMAWVFLLIFLLEPDLAWALPSFQEVKAAWLPSEAFLLDREGKLVQELRLDFKVRRLSWTNLDEMSPALIEAIVAAEDRRFQRHPGVDWRALVAAVWGRLLGRPARGASTITMQLVALLDPRFAPGKGRRDVRQKLEQMRAALELETRWSKGEILEAYLNRVGFRGELQGAAAAARAFFDKRPQGLSEAEAVLLAAVLPSPNAEPKRIIARACAITKAGGMRTDCAALRRLALAVLDRPARPDFAVELAPHLARRLLKSPGESLRTSLDEGVQRLVLNALEQQLRGLNGRNVRDGAALVVDNASGEVLAYVASGGPFSRAAKVDGIRARRQAGSTLKPLLYGLALEKRYLTAASILDDTPIKLETTSGLYIPQNYDRDFKGLVSVRTALASSLNIPAVRALILLGVDRFRDGLRDFGYLSISQPGEYYGFSLSLGSAEVSLLEQVNAYRTLANGGIFSPLRFFTAQAENCPECGKEPTRRVLSEAAAFIVSDILSDRTGRAVTFGLSNPLATRFWSAVKTGTSKDMRDNWCIGYSSRYTVGVWVGNFEGDSMRDVSGISGAAPAWLEIMNALHPTQASDSPNPPAGVVRRDIRFEPGLEPARSEWFIQGTETEIVRLADTKTQLPRIDSPANGVVIALDPDIPPRNQAVFFTARPPRSDTSFVLDGKTVAAAVNSHKWRPRPGAHQLALVGRNGKVYDQVAFSVRGLTR
ncbi:MAG: penicillin-binding protein 1C [Methylococcaceae bacterium]|nr:penicillin-binding protein 1C [Methylococcaceae bacterium]